MFEERVAALNNTASVIEPPADFEKRVYTVQEIMDILQISKTTAYALMKSGKFHSVRIGNQHRISKKSFDAWLDNLNAGNTDSQVCD